MYKVSIFFYKGSRRKKIWNLKIECYGQIFHWKVGVSHFLCNIHNLQNSKSFHSIPWPQKCIFRYQNHVYTMGTTQDIAIFKKKQPPFWKSKMAVMRRKCQKTEFRSGHLGFWRPSWIDNGYLITLYSLYGNDHLYKFWYFYHKLNDRCTNCYIFTIFS